ncbi:phage baseplate protein [Megasphaera elsdenii]|uniref:phage baseplate protein n=1 Tax=Megasphaera elsdenii TaxID=907 RepID=UPI0006C7F59E|nr:hypothetical protein [Megasphaera elsdenii]ALG42671.1 hypothetical protein AZ49_08965 [Megasphaera elsdenii 14-14]
MIQTTEVSITYKGDGVQTSFPYPYKYRNSDDIVGYIINDVGYETRITNNFKYDKVSNIYQYPLAGDPLAAPYSIKLIRETPQQQNADLPEKLPFSLIEKSLDWIIMILQEIGGRCNSLWHIRNDCKLSETNARNSASAAAESEENIANSENLAKKWATSSVSPDGKDDSFSTTGKTKSAKGWAMQAKEYAGSLDFSFLLNAFLPVGALIEFINDTDPNELYPGTTWVKMDAGRVLISAGTYTENGTKYTYNLGDKGGVAKCPLTTEEMPAHTHDGSVTTASLTGAFTTAEHESGNATEANGVFSVGSFASQNGPTSGNYLRRWVNFNGSHDHVLTINNTGNGTAHENRMPYIVVNRWRRTA